MNTDPLKDVQSKFDQLGVKDVKFLFSREALSSLPSLVLADVADVLEKCLNSEYRKVDDFSEEVLPQ